MADDKNIVGEPDRSLVSGSEDYEVQDFADKFDLKPERVRELIRRFGNDRETLELAARKRRA